MWQNSCMKGGSVTGWESSKQIWLSMFIFTLQAKERELELRQQWSANRQTRRQTQSKYGFWGERHCTSVYFRHILNIMLLYINNNVQCDLWCMRQYCTFSLEHKVTLRICCIYYKNPRIIVQIQNLLTSMELYELLCKLMVYELQ